MTTTKVSAEEFMTVMSDEVDGSGKFGKKKNDCFRYFVNVASVKIHTC